MDPGQPDVGADGAARAASFTAVAPSNRRTPLAIALLAIALVGVALVTKPAPGAVEPIASLAPHPPGSAPGASAGALVVMAPSGPLAPPELNPSATPYPPITGVPLRAGRVRLVAVGGIPITLSFDLPTGWQQASDAMYLRPDATPVPLSIGAWRLRHVNTFPCRWSAGVYADLPSSSRAEVEARALSSWWGQDPGMPPLSNSNLAPLASKPKLTTLLGYPAWYVEVLVPTRFDFSQCDGGQLVLWDATAADARYALGPSELNRIWVVDVDRGPIVIDAGLSLPASAAQEAELQAIIDSMSIEP